MNRDIKLYSYRHCPTIAKICISEVFFFVLSDYRLRALCQAHWTATTTKLSPLLSLVPPQAGLKQTYIGLSELFMILAKTTIISIHYLPSTFIQIQPFNSVFVTAFSYLFTFRLRLIYDPAAFGFWDTLPQITKLLGVLIV